MLTYESLLSQVRALVRPESNSERKIHWTSPAKIMGVARTPEGRIEIFLTGAMLTSSYQRLRDALEHGTWFRGASLDYGFEANRLVLPALGHYEKVAAFICTELSRAGVDANMSGAFVVCEPIIELAIERLHLSDAALIGLFGEMLLLDALTMQSTTADIPDVVHSWGGWTQSLRDISWGSFGVEVKATTRASSTHQVQGVHQVELNDGLTGGPAETGLMLVSVGLTFGDPHENSTSIPRLVERICKRLQDIDRRDVEATFLTRVREYGSGSGLGYDHATMAADPPFSASAEVAFVRGYDMTDPNVAVLRRSDVAAHQHVDVSSLTYVIDLPVTITGDLNPTLGAQQVAKRILGG